MPTGADLGPLSPCGTPETYVIETCEQHMSGLIDAAPLEDESNDAGSARRWGRRRCQRSCRFRPSDP